MKTGIHVGPDAPSTKAAAKGAEQLAKAIAKVLAAAFAAHADQETTRAAIAAVQSVASCSINGASICNNMVSSQPKKVVV